MSEHTNYRQVRWNILAVTISVIIGLVLLLPAIRPVPDRRRPMCMNHLKQLVLATTNFELTKKKYPGIQSLFGNQQNRGKVGSWVVSLLPYLEEQSVRDLWDTPTNQSEWESAWLKSNSVPESPFYPYLSWLRCPADERLTSSPCLTNYIANAGFYLLADDPALELPNYAATTSESQRSTIAQRSDNGVFVNQLPSMVFDPGTGQSANVFGIAKPVRSAEIRDGLSCTLAFVETARARSWRTTSITDDDVRCKVGAIWLYAGYNASPGRPEPMRPPMFSTEIVESQPISPNNSWPSSNHPDTFHAAMLDGSVMTISILIDYLVYQSLMTPHNTKSDIPDHHYVLKPIEYQ